MYNSLLYYFGAFPDHVLTESVHRAEMDADAPVHDSVPPNFHSSAATPYHKQDGYPDWKFPFPILPEFPAFFPE